MIYCPNCAEQTSANDDFCKRCGQRLRPLHPPSYPLLPQSASGPLPRSTGEITDLHTGAFEHYPALPKEDSQPRGNVQESAKSSSSPHHQVHRAPGAILRILDDAMSEHIIDKSVTLIGRSSKNDIALTSDRLVSRRHATLRFEGNGYVIIDEASANGTYIGEDRIAPHKSYPLRDGAELRIGSKTFRFEMRKVEPAKLEEMPTMLVVGEAHNAPGRAGVGSNPLRSLWQSSVFYPKLLGTSSWNALLVYAHLSGAISAVRQDAMRVLQEIDYSSSQSADAGEQMLLSDINITLIPEGEGVFFNPRRITLKGVKDWQSAIFRFVIRPELGAKIHSCTISVYMGPLLLNRIEIPLEFARQEPDEWPRASENCIQVTTRSFQKIYLAYNYSDRAVAMACQRITRLLVAAMPYLAEVEALRLRQVRGSELEQKMAEADVFQLFWSARTARSPYMQYEWENALARARPLVHPVYWDVPLLNPPATLNRASFSYVPLYTFS